MGTLSYLPLRVTVFILFYVDCSILHTRRNNVFLFYMPNLSVIIVHTSRAAVKLIKSASPAKMLYVPVAADENAANES